MRVWIDVMIGESAACAQRLARTSAPALVRRVLMELRDNRLLEDDRHDTIRDPDFATITALIVDLTALIRQRASGLVTDDIEGYDAE